VPKGAGPELSSEERSGGARDAFSALFGSAAVGACLTKLDSTLLEVNDLFCEMTGFSREELSGSALMGLFDAESRDDHRLQLRLLLYGSKPRLQAVPYRIRRKDGSLVRAQLSLSVVVPDPEGEAMVLIVVNNLTSFEEEQARHDLRDARSWLDKILGQLPVAVFAVASDGTLTLAHGRILPAVTEERIGKPMAESYAYVPELVQAVDQALNGNDQAFTLTDGTKHFDFLVNPVLEGDSVAGAVGVVIDMTDQRKSALAIAENAQKSRFLAAASHELRAPLNAILGFAQLLQEVEPGAPADRQRRYLQNIQSSGTQLRALINELLDLSKMNAGKMSLRIDRVEIRPAVLEAIARMTPVAEARAIRLVCGRQARTAAAAEPVRLAQILLNLISNAVKFSPESAEVEITSAKKGPAVIVAVKDSGIGVSPDQQELIFNEFYQVESASSERLEGTGLGLAVSRELARAMGGDLTVQSELGSGATFFLKLPAYPTSGDPGSPSPEPGSSYDPRPGRPTPGGGRRGRSTDPLPS